MKSLTGLLVIIFFLLHPFCEGSNLRKELLELLNSNIGNMDPATLAQRAAEIAQKGKDLSDEDVEKKIEELNQALAELDDKVSKGKNAAEEAEKVRNAHQELNDQINQSDKSLASAIETNGIATQARRDGTPEPNLPEIDPEGIPGRTLTTGETPPIPEQDPEGVQGRTLTIGDTPPKKDWSSFNPDGPNYSHAAESPDGSELQSEPQLSREERPLPDGTRIEYQNLENGNQRIWQKPPDSNTWQAFDVTSGQNGSTITYTYNNAADPSDIRTLQASYDANTGLWRADYSDGSYATAPPNGQCHPTFSSAGNEFAQAYQNLVNGNFKNSLNQAYYATNQVGSATKALLHSALDSVLETFIPSTRKITSSNNPQSSSRGIRIPLSSSASAISRGVKSAASLDTGSLPGQIVDLKAAMKY